MSDDAPESLHVDGSNLRFGIVAARFNQRLVNNLLSHVIQTLEAAGTPQTNIETVRVPGSHEVPYAAAMLARSGNFDCIIALGLVLAGDTNHHDMIAHATAHALQRTAIDSEIPVINGIITVNSQEQAEARCGTALNRGREFALAALEMAELKDRLSVCIDDLDDSFFTDAEDDGLENGEGWKK